MTAFARPAPVTPEVLTTVMRSANILSSAGDVVSVHAERVGAGRLAATYVLVPTYAGDAGAAPERLVAKLPAEEEASRRFAASMNCYSREVAFYSEVAAGLRVRTPECLHATVSSDGADFVLILEDLGPATECGQLAGCDVGQARVALEQAAALHAGSWEDRSLAARDWLRTGLDGWRQMAAAAPTVQEVFRERYADLLDDTSARVARSLVGGAGERWVDRVARPRCLWHSDFRLDNLLFDACGGVVPVVVLDWQSVAYADGTADASYFLGAGLPTPLRREHEESLLRHYHAALTDAGVTGYSWDECVAGYRMHAMAGFLIAVVVSVGTERSPEADALFTTMAARHAAHMEDWDTVALLGG